MATDIEMIQEKLAVLEADIRRFESRSNQIVNVIEQVVAAVGDHGDLDLFRKIEAIVTAGLAQRDLQRLTLADLPAGDAVH